MEADDFVRVKARAFPLPPLGAMGLIGEGVLDEGTISESGTMAWSWSAWGSTIIDSDSVRVSARAFPLPPLGAMGLIGEGVLDEGTISKSASGPWSGPGRGSTIIDSGLGVCALGGA